MQYDCVQLLKLLSDETRLRCLVLLRRETELCVCEFVHALGTSQPKISRHLAALRTGGIVADRRNGQWIYYRFNPKLPVWARQVIDAAVDAVSDRKPFDGDRSALRLMPDRPRGIHCT